MNDAGRSETTVSEHSTKTIDRLLVVAENIKILLLGPLLIGLAAWGICWVVPQSYTSYAILAVPLPPLPVAGQWQTQAQSPTQAAAMMVSPLVIDPVIESLKLADGRNQEESRKKIAEKIRATVGKDTLLRLEVTANSAVQAQAMGNALIESWLKTTTPGDRERADLEKRLASARASLEVVNRLMVQLADGGLANLDKPVTRVEAGTGIVAVGELQSKYLTDAISIQRALQGMSRDVIAQAPTLPIDASAPKKNWIAAGSAVVAELLLLSWIFVRQAWRLAGNDAMLAQKQARLANLLGLKTAPKVPSP